MVVVLPTPLTPTIRMTEGLVSSFSPASPTFRSPESTSMSPSRASSPLRKRFSQVALRIR